VAAELARTHGYAFDRFESSVHEQTCAAIAELIGREVLDERPADVSLESAVDLGRRAIAQARLIGDSVGHYARE
jgi:hypothetical protein